MRRASSADAGNVFSQESAYGAGESESWFSLMLNTSSLQHETSGQPCGLLEPVPYLSLAPIFFPFPVSPEGGLGAWSNPASLSFWETVSQSWWDTGHCLEEVMLQPVDVCHCSGVLNLQ